MTEDLLCTCIENKHLELSQAIKDDVTYLRDGVEVVSEEVRGLQPVALSKDIAQWHRPIDPSTNHNSARNTHQPATGAWLLSHQSYRNWVAFDTGLLWLNGKVCCRKTTWLHR